MSVKTSREVTLQNCRLRNPCPKPWDGMTAVNGNASIRFCDECQRRVHFCRTDKELAANVRIGNCVAFLRKESRPASGAAGPMWIGEVVPPYDNG